MKNLKTTESFALELPNGEYVYIDYNNRPAVIENLYLSACLESNISEELARASFDKYRKTIYLFVEVKAPIIS